MLDPLIQAEYAGLLYDVKGAKRFHEGDVSDPDSVGVMALDDLTLPSQNGLVMKMHCLGEDDVVLLRRLPHPGRLIRVLSERLFTQDVFPAFRRPLRPFQVQRVRQCHVHGVDLGIAEQTVVAVEPLRQGMLSCIRSGLVFRSRRHRDDFGIRDSMARSNQAPGTYPRRTQDPDANGRRPILARTRVLHARSPQPAGHWQQSSGLD